MYVAAVDPRVPIINAMLVKYGLSNRWLARKLEVNHVSLNSWLDASDGNSPRKREIYDSMIDVLREQGPKERTVTLARTGVRFLPVMGAIAAGIPSASQADVEWIEVLDWGGDTERWGRIIDGYSMADILLPGDIAIFEDRRPEYGDVVHSYKDGTDCVKAIRKTGDGDHLFSFNEDFDPFSSRGWKHKGVCVGRIRNGIMGSRTTTDWPHGLKWSMRHEKI